ncbi:hypothetical protein EIK79_03540 [Halocatena pleomorpha]|uniref:PIN domain-containing protein n=2 Tax=Halocatena pleomorpha TaxID=1785090 RepID=A0A3P3RI07_9EURY|nr:hypothetical protein EIK79_03540 [Halocatena pleomorpha]
MVVVDTSAFVSIAVGDCLELVFSEFDITTTTRVVDELKNTAAYDDPHGRGATAVLERMDHVTVRDVTAPELLSNRIDTGEASCIAVVRNTNASILVTDDFRALPELEALVETDVVLSPVLLRSLCDRGVLTESEVRSALETIATERDWLGAPIYRYARSLFE